MNIERHGIHPVEAVKDGRFEVRSVALAVCLLCLFALDGVVLDVKSPLARVYDGVALMHAPMQENLCVLTFDDGPSRNTPHILDVLREHGIKATFFMLGTNIRLYPDHVRRILAEGHEVGNHSFSHPNLRRVKRERKEAEIRRTHELLLELGANPVYMRPPYGSYDDDVVRINNELGLNMILWSVDSLDWKRRPANYAALRNADGLPFAAGRMHGIFLFHDPLKTTSADLEKIIADLRAGGCQRFVTTEEYVAAMLDPRPPKLMVKRPDIAKDATTKAKTMPDEGRADAESAPIVVIGRQSWPAGSAPLPLARSSRPWIDGPAALPHSRKNGASSTTARSHASTDAASTPDKDGLLNLMEENDCLVRSGEEDLRLPAVSDNGFAIPQG